MELHVYDFDGTLFGSPSPPAGYALNTDTWFRDPVSLSPPCVPLAPGPEWWHPDILPLAIDGVYNAEVYTILMTGRLATAPGLEDRIRRSLNGIFMPVVAAIVAAAEEARGQTLTCGPQHVLLEHVNS